MKFLADSGVDHKSASYHSGEGKLSRLGSGAYVRPSDEVRWQGGLYPLQTQLSLTVHVGARSALELLGLSHYLPMGKKPLIFLVSDKKEHLPAWFTRHEWDARINHRCLSLFTGIPETASTSLDCGGFTVKASSAERAIMETMSLARTNHEIEHSHTLMEGLITLRPDVVQELLTACTSVKVKRLFLWSAETSEHAWFSRLDPSKVDLGKGKRQIYQGGVYDQKYKMTIPAPEEQPDV